MALLYGLHRITMQALPITKVISVEIIEKLSIQVSTKDVHFVILQHSRVAVACFGCWTFCLLKSPFLFLWKSLVSIWHSNFLTLIKDPQGIQSFCTWFPSKDVQLPFVQDASVVLHGRRHWWAFIQFDFLCCCILFEYQRIFLGWWYRYWLSKCHSWVSILQQLQQISTEYCWTRSALECDRILLQYWLFWASCTTHSFLWLAPTIFFFSGWSLLFYLTLTRCFSSWILFLSCWACQASASFSSLAKFSRSNRASFLSRLPYAPRENILMSNTLHTAVTGVATAAPVKLSPWHADTSSRSNLYWICS